MSGTWIDRLEWGHLTALSHERHHRHTGDDAAYLLGFLDDDGMTLTDTPTLGPSCDNPLGIGK